jgi:death on curing protein
MSKHSADSLPVETKWIDIEGFEYLCFSLAREFMTYSEPIPDFASCDLALLDSALNAPRAGSSEGIMFYPTFEHQAAVLFYSMIKNHPFQNGNKRIAVMTLLAFLYINGKWIRIDPKYFYEVAYIVSESHREDREVVIKSLVTDLNEFIVSANIVSDTKS